MESRAYDRRHMELAVLEMEQSRSEHRDRPDPLVGAVLADGGGNLLGKVARASRRVGVHAEEFLIDTMLGDQDLEGATLYVTLEPCTARRAGKTPCAQRILDARISRIYVGMPDPNPRIEGHGIAKLANSGAEVDFFDRDLIERIRRHNAEYTEYFANLPVVEEEEEEFGAASDRERKVVQRASVDDLSFSHIEEYLASRGADLPVPSEDAWVYLARSDFVSFDSTSGCCRPTIAGVILFAPDPATLLVQMPVMVEAHVDDRVALDEISLPLADMPGSVAGWLSQYMRRFSEVRGLQRGSYPEYPLEVVREGVMNALVHRSFAAGARIHVKLFSDRLEIWSPGHPVYPITVERLRRFDAPQFSRNPQIAMAMRHMEYIDERADGIERMCELLVSAGMREPEYRLDAGYLVLTLFGVGGTTGELPFEGDLLEGLTPRQRLAIEHVLQFGEITTPEYARLLDMAERTARKYLGELCATGVLRRRGRGPSTRYVLQAGRRQAGD